MAVDKSEERVRRMFGEIAPRYDFLNRLLSLGVDRYWRWRATRRMASSTGPILDLCTGTGDLALALARRSAAPVLAADFCRPMLEIGRRKAHSAGLKDRIAFIEADAQNLPFPSNHFDLVTVAFGLRNVANTDRGLKEMVRVCRPSGQVLVLELTNPRIWPISSIHRWYSRRVLPHVGQALSRNGSSAYRYLPESVGEFPAYEALAERMRSAGLSQVAFQPLTLGIATMYLGIKPSPQLAASPSA